jgi:hypothetical protein
MKPLLAVDGCTRALRAARAVAGLPFEIAVLSAGAPLAIAPFAARSR